MIKFTKLKTKFIKPDKISNFQCLLAYTLSYVKFVMCTLLPVPGRNWISMGSLSQSLLTAHNSTQYTNAQQTDYSTPSMIHITLRLTRVVSTLTPQEVKNEIEEEQRRMYASRCSVIWPEVEVQI